MDELYTFDPMYQRLLGFDVNGAEIGGVKVSGADHAQPMAAMIDLAGKTAIVTGGARGLGFCVVNRLTEAGAKVMIVDIAVEFAQAAVDYFTGKGRDVRFEIADIRDLAQIERVVDATVTAFGAIDILVNNAAFWRVVKFLDLTEDTWDAVVDTGLKGTVFMTQAVARRMVEQGRPGRVVNVASIAGISMESTYGMLIPYVAAKSGVVGVSQSLARELKPLGISINCVLPGGMMSPGAMHSSLDLTPELREAMGEPGQAPVTDPDDVARVVFMLATPVSDFMHGATVVVDGGARLMIRK
jgi:NAD(P)-dependent dehydrogenase (short-subunit alcohol dehydrogenase family)